MDKFSELKEALEWLEKTPYGGEWDSALVGGENGEDGKNYHAITNADDEVVRTADDSRHTSWLCDYLEAVGPVNIRALLAELEAKDKRIAELEDNERLASDLVARNGEIEGLRERAAELESYNVRLREWNAGLAQESCELKAKLATPVRLPNKNDDEFWFGSTFQVAKFDRAVERAISAAGFTVGDE